jgi:hypothetical protein
VDIQVGQNLLDLADGKRPAALAPVDPSKEVPPYCP